MNAVGLRQELCRVSKHEGEPVVSVLPTISGCWWLA